MRMLIVLLALLLNAPALAQSALPPPRPMPTGRSKIRRWRERRGR